MKKVLCLVFILVSCLVGLPAAPVAASGPIILDFEDLENTGSSYHTMSAHNPYHEVTFGGPYGSSTLNHRNNAVYATPHSGSVYLFNGWGYDNLNISFAEPILFDGVWAGYPIGAYPENRAKELWLEGYLGTSKVGESAKITLGATMQLCAADFGGPVDKVVFRRSVQTGQSSLASAFYTLDDITFRKLTPPMLIDMLSGYVTGLALPANEAASITAKIGAAGQIVNDGNTKNDDAAINVIESFIKSTEAQRDKKIPSATADELIRQAQKIIDLLRAG